MAKNGNYYEQKALTSYSLQKCVYKNPFDFTDQSSNILSVVKIILGFLFYYNNFDYVVH